MTYGNPAIIFLHGWWTRCNANGKSRNLLKALKNP